MSRHPNTDIANTLRTAPEGYAAVTPWIISRDTRKLLDFARKAFGAEELSRVEGKNGSIDHAEFRIGDAVVMAFDASLPGRTRRRSSGSSSQTPTPSTGRP